MSGISQAQFLERGGPMQGIMDAKIASGELNFNYVYREYPKHIRRSLGMKTVTRYTDMIRGREVIPHSWDETFEDFETLTVHSEEEEESIISGGMSAAAIEAQQLDLQQQARMRGIQVDPAWSSIRLRRELGLAPTQEAVSTMQQQIVALEERLALRARIAELEARLLAANQPVSDAPRSTMPAAPVVPLRRQGFGSAYDQEENEREHLRKQLMSLGVKVDLRWAINRLHEELDAATAPTPVPMRSNQENDGA